jgi:uncharacterized membrane protein
MSTSFQDQQLEERLADIDRRLRFVESAVVVPPAPPGRLELKATRSVAPPARARRDQSVPSPQRVGAPGDQPKPAPATSLSDLVGGRVLAWIGGAATLVGIALFLVLAISRGWIGVEARVILAGLASSLLMAGGVWLHAKRGRTEASVVLVGVATAGLFATLLFASHVYGLIAPEPALVASMLVGALATALAIRWAGYAIAALGLIGALVSPVLIGVPADLTTVAILGAGAACATWVAIRQRWNWLGLASVLVCVPQWGRFVIGTERLAIGSPSPAVELGVLAWFAGLGLAGAIGMRHRTEDESLRASAAVLLTLNALVTGILGAAAFWNMAGGHGAALWLGGLALTHAAFGAIRLPKLATGFAIRRLSMVIGLVLADVALGLSLTGITLAATWAATSVGFAALSRRPLEQKVDRRLVELGLGAHIALTLVRTVLSAPPATLGVGTSELTALVAVALLAATCLACGQLTSPRSRDFRLVLHGLGLVAIAYLTAQALTGPALASAWALESLALVQLGARMKDPHARWGAAGFLVLAAGHALIAEAPPTALITGAESLPAAAVALGAIALALGCAARIQADIRKWLVVGAAMTLLYLGSVAIITVFQPTGAAVTDAVLDLSVRQQGQVLLSACWSLLGLFGLIAGLRRNLPSVRNAALAFLLMTVAKVFLYDLSTLTSIYRVVSFIAVGLLLLAGAFAYQRLRPPPVPDMRSVHPSQR